MLGSQSRLTGKTQDKWGFLEEQSGWRDQKQGWS